MQAKTVLYIDDDYQAGLLARVFLQKAGFDTELALNTRQAREILAAKTIHMVITDIGLPGENGVDFYRWLQASEFKAIPVFLVSAHAMGFSDVLTDHRDIFFEKPLFFPSFIERIKKQLGV